MQQNTKDLFGHRLSALDGDIGHVRDFYFEDEHWVIRYLIADTGSWLPGRFVLLPPQALGKWDLARETLHVNLKKQQIKDSPPIELHVPVSRQYEVDVHRYYGWPGYWFGGGLWGFDDYPVTIPPWRDEMEYAEKHRLQEDKHLRSIRAVTGFHVEATDGTAGKVRSFVVDEASWALPQLVVETGHWLSGKQILVATSAVRHVSTVESKIDLILTKAAIAHAAEADLAGIGAASNTP